VIYTQHGGAEDTEGTEKGHCERETEVNYMLMSMPTSRRIDRNSRLRRIFTFFSSVFSVPSVPPCWVRI
jgi:hypothetical protein